MSHLAATAIDRRAQPVEVRQWAGGSYVDGIFHQGSPDHIEIRAFITAASANDIQHAQRVMPEGDFSTAEWVIWTRFALNIADDGLNPRSAAEVFWRDEWHRVQYVWPRPEGGFTKAILRAIRDRGRTVQPSAHVADQSYGPP